MVYILLGEGFEETEAIVPADLLRRAGVEVALVGVDGPIVTGGHGISIQADLTLDQVDDESMEMLVLPGGMGGVAAIQMNLFATALIQKAYDRGCWLGAICAAPTILAAMGMLDRRPVACYPGMLDEMGSAGVLEDAQVVADGRFITAQAAGSAFLFGLKLVEMLKGTETAEEVRNAVVYRG